MKDYACISAEEKVAGFVISGHRIGTGYQNINRRHDIQDPCHN